MFVGAPHGPGCRCALHLLRARGQRRSTDVLDHAYTHAHSASCLQEMSAVFVRKEYAILQGHLLEHIITHVHKTSKQPKNKLCIESRHCCENEGICGVIHYGKCDVVLECNLGSPSKRSSILH